MTTPSESRSPSPKQATGPSRGTESRQESTDAVSPDAAASPETTASPEDLAATANSNAGPCDLPNYGRSGLLMSRDDTGLLVVDVQEKLLPAIHLAHRVVWNIRRLIDGASVLGVTAACSEQYPKGLGPTVAELAERLPADGEKAMFSCREMQSMLEHLRDHGVSKVLVCGIESHVCVQQTALDLLAAGFDVFIAIDACGSRNPLDHEMAARRMENAGVIVTTTEAALFEWCETSGTPEFKRISALVRESAPPPEVLNSRIQLPPIHHDFVVQTNHQQRVESDRQITDLEFIVRQTHDGAVVKRFNGRLEKGQGDDESVLSSSGVIACELASDGTTLSVQHSDGKIEMAYLPIRDSVSHHPRWKIRRLERHINSPEYKTDYEITFQVIEYTTGNVFREFHGYEHRVDGGGLSLASGIRHIEISADGRWMVVTSAGRPPELLELPAERHRSANATGD